MKIYHNGIMYAVADGHLILVGTSLYEHETESRLFHSDYAVKRYLSDHGYKLIKDVMRRT